MLAQISDDSKEFSESIRMGLYSGLISLGEYEVAEEIAKTLERTGGNDISKSILSSCIARNNTDQSKRRSKYQELNSQGIGKYTEGNLEEALDLFKEAIRKVPGNSNAILNKIQVLIDMTEIQLKKGFQDAKKKARSLIMECSSDLDLLDGIRLSEIQAERASQLRKDFFMLQKQATAK